MARRITTNAQRDRGQPTITTPAFVGRRAELVLLRDALSRPPVVVLVEGEAGIGKSRLLQEYLGSPERPRLELLQAVCPPFREPFTLGPIVDAVRDAMGEVDGTRLTAVAGALRAMLPEWAEILPPAPEPLADATAARHRLFRALAEVLDALRIDVAVVEDAHWADDATLEFLLFLASRRPRPTSLLVTYRPDDVPADSLLLRLTSRPSDRVAQVRIAVKPLDVSETSELVSSMLAGEPLSDEFATYLHAHTEGVPFALEESVRLMHAQADLRRLDSGWVRRDLDRIDVPPTVRDAVLERVSRLGPDTREVLTAAAVLIDLADDRTLIAVSGLPAGRARAGLAEAITAGLLGEGEQRLLGFRHALAGRAVYDAIPEPRRRAFHLRAGQALEATAAAPVARLARHYRQAREPEKWREYAERAADQAMDSGDAGVAITLLNDLLTIADLSATVRVRLARKLTRAAMFRREVGDDLLDQILDTVRNVLDSPGIGSTEVGELRSQLGRLLRQLRRYKEGQVDLERAIAELKHNPVEAARVMLSLAWPLSHDDVPTAVHLRWLRRAATLPMGDISPADRISLINSRATALLQLGQEEGWTAAAALPRDASEMADRLQLAAGYLNVGDAALDWGRFAEATEWLSAARTMADADGFLWIRDILLATQAHLDWFTGRWSGLAGRVADLADRDDLDLQVRVEANEVAGLLDVAAGSRTTAEDRLRFVLDQGGRLGVRSVCSPAAALGRLWLSDGRVDDALSVTLDPIRTITVKGIWISASNIAPARVEVLLAAGRAADAEQVVSAFTRGVRGRSAPAALAALTTCRAILLATGDPVRAAAAFARAAVQWEQVPRPYDALLTRERAAQCLCAAGRDQDGVALLTQVFHALADLGARGDAERVRQRLRTFGVEVRRPWRGGRRGYGDRLSPRELEVVRLVVAGRTNREIAQALSRSPRTIDGQLASAMRKLKVSSRTALAVRAVEASVVPRGSDPSGTGQNGDGGPRVND